MVFQFVGLFLVAAGKYAEQRSLQAGVGYVRIINPAEQVRQGSQFLFGRGRLFKPVFQELFVHLQAFQFSLSFRFGLPGLGFGQCFRRLQRGGKELYKPHRGNSGQLTPALHVAGKRGAAGADEHGKVILREAAVVYEVLTGEAHGPNLVHHIFCTKKNGAEFLVQKVLQPSSASFHAQIIIHKSSLRKKRLRPC